MENQTSNTTERVAAYVADGTASDVIARYASLPRLAASLNFGELDSNIVVVDTETTGFSFTHDELIQIAAARIEQGEVVDWYVTFVNPGKPIPEDVVHLTDIHDSDVQDAPSPQEALAGLVEFAGTAKMVAHNVEFDRTFTTRHPEGYPLLENDWIDSLDLSRIALPKLKSHRLIDLVHAFDAPVSTHRADADVQATCVVYRILLAAVCSMPFELVRAIAGMSTKDQWFTQVVFAYLASRRDLFDAAALALAAGKTPAPHALSASVTAQEQPASAPQPSGKRLFSLRSMRAKRVSSLPERRAKKDAQVLLNAPEGDSAPAGAADAALALSYPSAQEVDGVFAENGLLALLYPEYEQRPEQLAMSQAVATAFRERQNLAVEAGTGVGKSMAYLAPAALLARSNDISVGVATKTNALLDQLVFQELPALAKAFQESGAYGSLSTDPLTFAALKGISHYPCLRKIDHLVDDGPAMRLVAGKEVSQAPALAALLSFIEQSEFDDIDTLKIDFRALPRYAITSTATECLKRKCPYHGTLCFGRGARQRAESADIVVTNHALLFCDLVADGGLLPPIRYWVVDEAHDAEEEARKAFTKKVDCAVLLRICEKLLSSSASRNVFARAESRISSNAEASNTLFFGLIAKCKSESVSFTQIAQEFCAHAKDLLYYDTSKNKNYERFDLWLNDEIRHSSVFRALRTQELALVQAADKLIKAMQDLVAYLEGVDEAAEAQREIASLAIEIKDLRQAAELIFEAQPADYAYQASLNRKKDKQEDSFEALPLDVGRKMQETLYARTHSVAYASATITVGNKFDAFVSTMGLGASEESLYDTLQLASSFDFDNNMVVYVAKDMPEPNSPSYLPALQRLLVETHLAQHGSMLTLFTNRREMEKCYDEVRPALKADDLRLVCQKWGVSVKGLRDDFVADETLSLFALKSFWQGFDAPGATLKGVIIPKLPFARPDDPLYLERASRDDAAWRHYVLPQAIIETRQAAGRLIRKASDTGVLILADKRLLTKSYGKTVLGSLPSKTVRVCTIDEIAQSLRAMAERGW